MVAILWALVAFFAGLGAYFLIPLSVTAARVSVREKVGTPYLKMGVRCLKQFSAVRRVLSGYDILPINVDAEQKQLKVTLNSKRLGDDEEYRFNDPDNRIKRLWNKPVTINFELVPAAVDAGLSELGHWVREKRIDTGLYEGDPEEDYENVTVDPYIPVDTGLRLIDPIDVFELTPNDIDPENIKSAEAHTRQRYAEYGSAVSLTDIMSVLMGFGVGMVAMAGAAYVRSRLIGGASGGGGISNPIDSVGLWLGDPTWVDVVVTAL